MTNVLAVAVDAVLVNRISRIRGHRTVSIDRENFTSIHEDPAFLPDLILVGSGLTHEQALRYTTRVLHEYPHISVLLVGELDPSFIREATAAGVRGVIPTSIGDRELAGLIERAGLPAPTEADISASHQVIVVASPKGGVGKTTMAVNLSALLAEQAPGEVVLLDLDLQFGDVATVLDLQPEYTLADALHSGSADSMLLRTLLVPHPANFSVLCGADHPAAVGAITGDEIRKLVHQFSSNFRYVVIDTSAGLPEETLASLEEASDVVFVATLDVATLRNVRKEVEVLADLGLLPERRHVIINRTDRLSGLTQKDAENTLGLPVDVTLTASAVVPLAANHGRLAVEDKKAKSVSRPLRKFARTVADLPQHPGRHR